MKNQDDLGFEPIEDSDDLGFEETPQEKTIVDDAIDTVKGFGVGGLQGATFGSGDEIGAALKTAYDAPGLDYSNGLSALMDRYRSNVKGTREYVKEAEENAPVASFAGNMVGGFVSPVNKIGVLAKGASLGANALQAAKLGAVAGFNSSEADILQNPENVALDTATGAAIGGVIPIGLAATKGAGGMMARGASALNTTARDKVVAYNDTVKALQYGKKGVETTGTDVMDDLVARTRSEITEPIVDTVAAARKASGSKLGMFRDEAAAMGYKIPMDANLDDMMNTIKKVTSEEDRTILTKRLKELIKFNKETSLVPGKTVTGNAALSPEQKAQQELLEQREMLMAKNKELGIENKLGPVKMDAENNTALFTDASDEGGKVYSRSTRGESPFSTLDEVVENTTPMAMDNKQLRSLSEEMKFLKTKVGAEGQHAAETIENQSRNLSKEAIGDEIRPSYDTANDQYATSARIFSRLDDKLIKNDVVDKETTLAQADDLFRNVGGDAESAIKKRDKLKNMLVDLDKINPDFASKMKSTVDNISDRWDLNKKSRREGFSGLGGSVGSVGIKAGETAGLMTNKANKIISAGKKYITDNTPEAVRDLANKLINKGESKYSSLLTNIADKPERTRNALIFSLMQRPDFRQAISEDDNGSDK